MTAARLGIQPKETLTLKPEWRARQRELELLTALEAELRQPPVAEIYGGKWNDDYTAAVAKLRADRWGDQ